MTTPPSTTPDIDATNCATETDVQEALILTTTDAVDVVYWFLFLLYVYSEEANNSVHNTDKKYNNVNKQLENSMMIPVAEKIN